MKFLCDQMLGKLAKWLRLIGFDTYYADSKIDDNELLDIAKDEDRVFITRDKELMYRAKKEKIQILTLRSTDLDEQLTGVLKKLDLDEKAFFTRCSLCNGVLKQLKKEDAKKFVPDKAFENNDRFWFCPKCEKAYWKGSHYDKILCRINKIKKL